MQVSMMGISVVTFLLLGFALLGGPMILVDWLRTRRQTAIDRQIALTDALDGRFGAMIAPVVTKPFFGPWEIQIAVPLRLSAALPRILSVVDDVFSGVKEGSTSPYRIVLSTKPDLLGVTRTPRSRKGWAGDPIAVAR